MAFKGKKLTEEHKHKLSMAMKGKRLGKSMNIEETKHWLWKDKTAGVRAIHQWVVKWKGRPDTCEKCGKSGLSKCQIQWANVDHQYRRVLDDFMRLCSKCHGEYDKERGFRKRDGVYLTKKQWVEIMSPTSQVEITSNFNK